jgi:hypothetical protein
MPADLRTDEPRPALQPRYSLLADPVWVNDFLRLTYEILDAAPGPGWYSSPSSYCSSVLAPRYQLSIERLAAHLRVAQTADDLPPYSPCTIDADVADAFMLASAALEDIASDAGPACSIDVALFAVAGKLSHARARRLIAAPGPSVEDPSHSPSAANPTLPEAGDKNSQAAAFLRENPYATCKDVAERIGLSPSRVRNLDSWKENKARVRERSAKAGTRERTNKEEAFDAIHPDTEDPSEIAAAVDTVKEMLEGKDVEGYKVLEQGYVNRLNPAGHKQFARLNADERKHAVLSEMLLGDGGALDERAYTPKPQKPSARRARASARHE